MSFTKRRIPVKGAEAVTVPDVVLDAAVSVRSPDKEYIR